MSSISVAGDTSGTCTLQAPAVSGSTVLTLPTTSATLITDSSGILNIGSGQVYKDASGNVGIGTSSPAGKLHVSGGRSFFAASSEYFAIGARYSPTGGSVYFGATDATATPGVQISAATGASLLNIDSSGNVGIGTSTLSSATKLEVYGNSAAAHVGVRVNNTANDGYASLWLSSSASNDGIIRGGSTAAAFTNQLAMVTSSAIPITFSTNNTERMRIDSSGNLLVGTTSNTVNNSNSFVYRQDLGAEILNHISGTVTGSQYIYFGYNGSVIGSVTQNLTTGVLYNVSSDQRLKTNIQPAGSAIQSILDFPVDQFDWISNSSHQDFGGVAQKILKVIPEMVSVPENPEEMMGVDWSKAVPRLIKTIQELKAIIDTQQEQINSLLGK